MIDDLKAIEGKIKALAPSWELMAEFTGKPSSATMIGLYAKHFVENHVAMHDVNLAVEQILVGWKRGFWPSPEEIVARAKEIARINARMSGVSWDVMGQIEEVYAQVDARKWECRLGMANEWRMNNPDRFKRVVRGVDGMIEQFIRMINLKPSEQEKLLQSGPYRKAFRDGAVVGGCNDQAGIDERIRERRLALQREEAARQFGAAEISSTQRSLV